MIVGPHQGMAWPRGGLDKPRVHRSVEVLLRGVATVHNMEIFVFCFVLLFHYSEDLSIGLMRTL